MGAQRTLAVVLATLVLLSAMSCAKRHVGHEASNQTLTDRRPFLATHEGRWIGNAISYGPHRDGQRPGQVDPTREQIREDLKILLKHWNMLRVYGSEGPAEILLEVIRADAADMKVVLGVWIAPEENRDDQGAVTERFPDARRANQAQVDAAVRLAAEYPGIVRAICVGNETQVFWSAHRSPADILIRHVRRVRASTIVPVSVADDFNFWNKPESHAVAAEIDFMMLHAHPAWNGQLLDEAMDWTKNVVQNIQKAHPSVPVVLAETGWATQRHTEGEQAQLIKGALGEEEQRIFYDRATAWARETKTPMFYFEAFDENWKGGDHPNEVEKHWGLYHADRTPKLALKAPRK